jgi:hypothetical protein
MCRVALAREAVVGETLTGGFGRDGGVGMLRLRSEDRFALLTASLSMTAESGGYRTQGSDAPADYPSAFRHGC